MGLFDFFRRKNRSGSPRTSGAPPKNGAQRKSDANSKNGAQPADVDATCHCFVLCKAADPGDLSQAGRIAAEVLGPDYSADEAGNFIVTVTRGGETVGFLAHLPAPIPDQEAEEYADHNIFWPDGKAEAAKHRSHVIVTNAGGLEQEPVESALEVSRLALFALRLFDGLGVYWGNAQVTNSREMFETFCSDLTDDRLPVPAWLRFQLTRAEGEEFGLYTLGMDQFGLMEIEVERSTMEPMELMEFVSNFAAYLIKNGPVVVDGNTVGGSEEERILVRHRPSMVDKDRKVYKVVFE